MADSPDAILLKRRARRRLVGAIALVVFIVIVLPIALDQEPKPVNQTLTVQSPSRDGGPFNTRVLPPLTAPPATPAKSSPPAALADEPEAAKPKPAAPAANSRSRAAAKDGAKAGGKQIAKTDVAERRRAQAVLNDEAYIVPIGAFANPENVKQVQDKAASAGIESYTEKVTSAQGEQIRVRAGPFQSRDAAEKAREKLKSLGLEVGQVAQR